MKPLYKYTKYLCKICHRWIKYEDYNLKLQMCKECAKKLNKKL